MKTIILFLILFCIPLASAFQLSSADYITTGELVLGIHNTTSADYALQGVLGQDVIGRSESADYILISGILGPVNYISPSAEGPSGAAGGGGAGCSIGFYKNEFGECVSKELPVNVTVIDLIPKSAKYPPVVILFILGVITVIIFIVRSFKPKKKKKKPKPDEYQKEVVLHIKGPETQNLKPGFR